MTYQLAPVHRDDASAEFFDAENTPDITFSSTDADVDRDGAVSIRGDLTVKGITHPVTVAGQLSEAVEHFAGGERRAADLTTTIDRTLFGLTWNAPLPKGGFALGNDVTLSVHLEFQNA